MKNRYLPFGYEIADGKIVADSEQVEAVRRIFDAYTAGQTFQQIADVLSAQGIHYRSDAPRWNKNMVSRILANADYCGTAEYPQIITAEQLEMAEQIRKSKSVTYSETLKPFRKDMQCGCCGARLYWHPKSNQWFCRECGMWSKPPRKLSIALWKNCDGSGRTSNSSTRQRARRMCNQWKLPCWIVKLGKH